MEKEFLKGSLDDILSTSAQYNKMPFSVKNARGQYIYANDAWGELAEVVPSNIAGKRDDQLPWGSAHGDFVFLLDAEVQKKGSARVVDRRPHFSGKFWIHSNTEKFYLRDKNIIVSKVNPSTDEDFCGLANQISEKGIVFNGMSFSIKQLYLLHQLLFHVPQKQSARELGCSTNRINQYLRDLRDRFEAEDSKELMCALSANGLLPLLEHFDLIFKHDWVASDLRFQ